MLWRKAQLINKLRKRIDLWHVPCYSWRGNLIIPVLNTHKRESNFMKKLPKISLPALMAMALLAMTAIANATPFQIPLPNTDIAKNGTGIAGGNSNDDANNFFRLNNIVTAYNIAHPLAMIPTPVATGALDLTSNDQSVGTPLAGFQYAVLHYGVGNGGVGGSGGGVAFYDLNGMTSFLFPANGLGPNGFGGFSSLTLFNSRPTVPDGGGTLMLLGCAISGLGVARRFVRR